MFKGNHTYMMPKVLRKFLHKPKTHFGKYWLMQKDVQVYRYNDNWQLHCHVIWKIEAHMDEFFQTVTIYLISVVA